MNEIKIKVKFKKGLCIKSGINLKSGDYNSTKLIFDLDIEDGKKIFEMKDPDGKLVFADEILNNEVILARFDENGQAHSLFNQEGKYFFEISLYKENSKLTSASNYFEVKPEQVGVGDEIVEMYLPVFDKLMNELQDLISQFPQDGVTGFDKHVTGIRLENKILILSFNDQTELSVDLSSLSNGSVVEELTEEQIKGINEMIATTGEELILEYDNDVLDIDFTIEDNNLIVTNNVAKLDFNINENGEMEAIY